ncbi:AEC family transporter [Trichocoleus sp. FACHB-90]|uniref:AEC family transporter n=1 Tax=Cyanophyceae TaxID=3028117 RepID=UPI00168A3332|nr:AEC family transporter [Trichocoleus sp. FACHB-90]MBD1929985.1 AEC family transporter [Trichocoleus sp. FACHB-90]
MPPLVTQLLELYLRLGGSVLLGWILGRQLPKVVPAYLGKFLFWIGVPISIFAFLRHADLSGPIWIASVAAWVAIFFGAGLAWIWIVLQGGKEGIGGWGLGAGDWGRLTGGQNNADVSSESPNPQSLLWSKPTQGSFLLASMVGNTGYLGYPVTLALVGSQYFGWALFYDLLGTTLGAYGLGVVLAARFGMAAQSHWKILQAVVINPALWSFALGLIFRNLPLSNPVEESLRLCGWGAVALSLVLIGMRLSQLSDWDSLGQAWVSLGIKMLLVPMLLGLGLLLLGVSGSPLLVIVLQMAMPPAFATLILAEAYDLDRNLTVTALAVGSTGLLFTLPVWLLLFGR